MNKTLKPDRYLTIIKEKIVKMFHNNNNVLNKCTLINTTRFYYFSFIVILDRIIQIFLFARATPVSKIWKQGIILSHSILLAFWVGVLFITYRLKNKTQANTTMHILQYIVPIVAMAFGVTIVTIDQLITTNITPFLLVSIIIGTVFLIRPLVSAIIYLISYLAYYYSIALTITDQQVLLSNRVNGTTAIGIGFSISVIIWCYNYTNITQKRHIEIQQKQLKRMAYYDPLTNLYNRRFFNKTIEKEFSSMQRHGYESVIIILDIDDFKNVNDTYGHLVGDQVLKQLARLIADNIRKSDIVSRFGGEEFIILAPNTPLEGGFLLAEKLRKSIAENPFTTNSTTLHITASFGVSLLQITEKYGLENYFSLADNALYLAKKQGKNRVKMTF